MTKEFPKCLVPNCTGFAASRGLCVNDYYKALRMVRSGRTTWDFLIEKGLAHKSNRIGNKSDFMKAYQDAGGK